MWCSVYCLSNKAINIEDEYSLTTDSLMSLRRCVVYRGNVRIIRSDHGPNLVGVSTEFTCAFEEMDHFKIGNFFKI